MEISLTANAERLLRTALARHPGQFPAEIVEHALADQVQRETVLTPKPQTREEFHVWLEQFAAYSDNIPPMPGETFSREMIYRDDD